MYIFHFTYSQRAPTLPSNLWSLRIFLSLPGITVPVSISVLPSKHSEWVICPPPTPPLQRFGQALLSDEKRASLQSELDSVRLELEDTRETLKAVTAHRADLEEELVAIRGETKGYMAKVQSGVLVKDFFARRL